MIVDITNEIYTQVKTAITDATVLQAYPDTDPTFPCIIMEEASNISNDNTHDSAGDHHADIMIEVNIYTIGETKISKAKSFRNQIDSILNGNYNMKRVFSEHMPTANFPDVYRYVMRYEFTIDSNNVIYRG